MFKNIETCFFQDDIGNHFCRYKDYLLSSVFQPIFDQAQKIIGVEALVRIKDGSQKPICSGFFFSDNNPKQEDKLAIDVISRVLHLINFASSQHNNYKLFLNYLPNETKMYGSSSINEGPFAKELKHFNIQAEQIVLELLEVRCNNLDQLRRSTQDLNQYGFSIAIDDFGTEYSNRDRVRLISPNIVKIDRSLLNLYMEGNKKPLIDAINIAKTFEAKTVIEGIEDQQQLDAMQAINIDMYQGYFLAIPKPVRPAA